MASAAPPSVRWIVFRSREAAGQVNPILTKSPSTDPTAILRYRDGLYAADLLAAAVSHLDFFTWLDTNPAVTDGEICDHFGFAPRPLDVLLTLCRANAFLRSENGKHTLSDLAREHLVRHSPYFLGPYFDSMKERPVTLDYLEVLKSGRPANWASLEDREDWHKAMLETKFAREFTAAMNCRGLALGQALAKAVSPHLQDRKRLLDVGGGSGIYAATLAARQPRLTGVVLEQAPVDEIARRAIAEQGLADRIEVVTGNMFTDPWPDADVHLLSNVLHDWDFPEIRAILRRSAEALAPGGLVIIHEVFVNDGKTGPLPAAEYSALLMHVTQGKCYSPAEYGAILRETGFAPGPYRDTLADRGFMTAVRVAS